MDFQKKLNNLGVSSDSELKELAKKLNIHIDDILDFRKIKAPLPKAGIFIILLRKDLGIGHWCCIYNNEYFDPIGLGPPSVFNIDKYNEKQYQSTYNEYCGLYCLLWLYSKQHNRSDLLNGFIDMNTKIY